MKDKEDIKSLLPDFHYGTIGLESWFDMNKNGDLIGMGKTTTYDRDGNVLKVKIEPTGMVVTGAHGLGTSLSELVAEGRIRPVNNEHRSKYRDS